MKTELCAFSLAFPDWLPWVAIALGLLVLAGGLWGLFSSSSSFKIDLAAKSLEFGNLFPVLLAALGLIVVAGGIAGVAAERHSPTARWIASYFPSLIADEDLGISVDLNSEPLAQIAARFSSQGRYVVRMTPAARQIRIGGKYRAACDADLMSQICRQSAQGLACETDKAEQVLRVCARAEAATCKEILK